MLLSAPEQRAKPLEREWKCRGDRYQIVAIGTREILSLHSARGCSWGSVHNCSYKGSWKCAQRSSVLPPWQTSKRPGSVQPLQLWWWNSEGEPPLSQKVHPEIRRFIFNALAAAPDGTASTLLTEWGSKADSSQSEQMPFFPSKMALCSTS